MNNNYENKILDAIQTLVDNAVSKANYDKTIKALVVKCVNKNKGEYVIKYQDSTFYAYSNDLDSVYRDGTSVYVLVPSNDMAQTKTILGSVDRLGSEYIELSESNTAYQEVGTSITTSDNDPFGISSYEAEGDSLVLYDKESNINLIDIDLEGAELYLQNASYMTIGGTFSTQLNDEQKRKGNYGLVFNMSFRNGEEIVDRNYVIDINSMVGDPYSYNRGSEQSAIFEIDGENFVEINKITFECKSFPNSATPAPNDIFVEDVILKALTPLTRDEVASNSLTFITKQGIYFHTINHEETRLIETEVKINKNVIPSDSNLLRYYWFKEDSRVGTDSPDYLPFGGLGWKCINAYNVIDEENNTRDYLVNNSTLTVVEGENQAAENEYKCVVIYNNEVQVERNIIIYNKTAQYTVTIESSEGNYFKRSVGRTTLTCNVATSGTAPTYTYKWTVTDNTNRTTILETTDDENEDYAEAIATRNTLLARKENGVWSEEDEEDLLSVESTIANYENNVQRIDGNKIYNLQLSTITNFSKFTCSVYSGNTFLGKSNIVITNSWSKDDNGYSLLMENANQIFKYNVNGIAPTSKSLEKPIIIKPLQFSLYDNLGNQVEDNKIKIADVSWYVPKDNTMITVVTSTGDLPPEEEDGYLVYNSKKTLDFNIAPVYSNQRMNNTIKLVVRYDDRVLTAVSGLEFVKEGEIGTNGTNYVCRIVPNVMADTPIPNYPIYKYNTTTQEGDINFIPAANKKWFKVELYKDGLEIYSGVIGGDSQEDKPVTVDWSMLINKYDTAIEDSTNFVIDNSTGEFEYINCADTIVDGISEQDRAANIVKATVTYDGATYYATMPIILVKVANNKYRMDLTNNTGFRYVMYTTDGLNPVYDSSNPFAVRVYETNEGTEYDITMSLNNNDFNWATLGAIYVNSGNGSWSSENNLIERNITVKKNEKTYRPIEIFNGLSVNNGLKCVITKNNSTIATMYLPIHFYLNRFGNAALNGWDGNHIEINEDGGFILAPQIGAGKKDSNNAYTGIFMGAVKEAGSDKEEIGLFGYNAGERTIALDAEDGSARFGKTGQGQIVIDPDAESAKIYSDGYNIDYKLPSTKGQTKYLYGYTYFAKDGNNNYYWLKENVDYQVGSDIPTGFWTWHNKTVTTYLWDTSSSATGAGLEIDLNDPHIRFGNGAFHVEKDGTVYAKGYATISELQAGDIDIPGVENFKIEFATDTAQFETDANYLPKDSVSKTLTCYGYFKNSATSGYTATLVDSTGTAIPNPSIINGVQGAVSKSESSQATTLTLSVASTRTVTSANTVFYIKFEHTESHDIVTKAFNANLIIMGKDGQQGPKGDTGAPGQNGKDGKDGKDGTSVTVKGTESSISDLCQHHSSGNTLGDGYIIGLNLYVFTNGNNTGGADPDDWQDVGQFKGQDGQDGADGKDAKRCFLVATGEIFKSADGGQSYSPSSISITPYLQAVSLTTNPWSYSINGGTPTPLTPGQYPTGITIDSNNILTVANNCGIFAATDTIVFICQTTDNDIYDTISITRVKDGIDGQDGQDGQDGRDGTNGTNGINTATIYLYGRFTNAPTVKPYGDTSTGTAATYTFASHSLSPAPTQTGWDTTMPSTGTDPLYVSMAVVASDQATRTINPDDWSTPERMAQDGANGQTGRGITSSVIEYVIGASGTQPPGSSANWSTSFPSTIQDGDYLWERTTLNYSDNTSDVSYNVSRKGVDGNDGDSITIESQVIEYGYNSSGTSYADIHEGRSQEYPGGWDTSIPDTPDGKYLWTRTTVNYSDETSTVSYTVSYQSVDGAEGPAAYTILLDNESHSFPAEVESSTDIKAIVYKGATQITNYTFDEPSIPSSLTGKMTATRRDSNKTIRVTAKNTLDVNSGDLTFYINADSKKFEKKFSWSLAKVQHTWIKYAPKKAPSASEMSDNPTGMTYIGICTTTASTAPATPSSYQWSKYVGADGSNGTDGFSVWTTTSIPTASTGGTYYIGLGAVVGPKDRPDPGEILMENSSAGQYQYVIDGVEEVSGQGLVVELRNRTGMAPTAYSLIVTPAAVVKHTDNTYSPNKIILTAKYQTGDRPIGNYINGKYEIYLNDNVNPEVLPAGTESPPNFEYTIPANTASILVKLYNGTPGTTGVSVVDEQKVTVVTDGEDGDSATNVVCGNEAQIIPCDENERVIAATTITIPFAGYIGGSKVACTVDNPTLPSGMSVTSNTPGSASADGSLVLTAAANSPLGNATSGVITLTFHCNSLTFIKKFAWSKSIRGANARVYEIEPSSAQIVKTVDDSFAPNQITFTSTYRVGESATKTNYNCRWIIRVSDNGTTWHTIYKSNADPASANTYILTVGTHYTDIDTQEEFDIDPKFFMAYLCPRGTSATVGNALASCTVPVLNDSTDIEIGGRNYFLLSNVFSNPGTGASGVTPSITPEEAEWQIVVTNGSGRLHTWNHPNIIKPNFKTGDSFVFSLDLKRASGSSQLLPKISFKSSSPAASDYYTMIGSVSSSWTRIYCVGTWDDSWEPADPADLTFTFDWSGLAGTYLIRKLKFEQGNVLTDWSPASEDTDSAIDELIAKSVTTSYISTSTSDAPNPPTAANPWSAAPPVTSTEFIWQITYYEFADATKNYYSEPICIYTPAKLKTYTEYCLCDSREYSSGAIVGVWQDHPYAWDDSYLGQSNNEVLRYQFIRTKYVNENEPEYLDDGTPNEKYASYSTPVRDDSWHIFGQLTTINNRTSAQINTTIGNNNVSNIKYNQDGLIIEDPSANYGVKITKQGVWFKLPADPNDPTNKTWQLVWNINGTLNANLIDVNQLKANNILSGMLSLNTFEDNEASFILNGPKGNIAIIDSNGVKVTSASGDITELSTNSGDGFKATAKNGTTYFYSDPTYLNTTMTNATVTNDMYLGDKAKMIQTGKGISIVSSYSKNQ